MGDALTVVKSIPDSNGLEAWRKLWSLYSPKSGPRHLQLLRQCLNPARIAQYADAPTKLATWESQLRQVEPDYGEKLSDAVKRTVLLMIAPGSSSEHIGLHQSEHMDYPTL